MRASPFGTSRFGILLLWSKGMTGKNELTILGIHHTGPITSAALIRNGRILAAAPEERFSRIKYDRAFPHRAIEFCFNQAGVRWGDIDAFAVGWNPGENVGLKYRGGFSDWMRYPGEWLSSVPNHLLSRMERSISGTLSRFETPQGETIQIHFVDHHLCHSRLGLDLSGWDECAVLVVDGWSENKVTSMYHARNGDLELLRSKSFPHSIGCLYATLTDFLGFRVFQDEWKVMGMAAYGEPSSYPEIQKLIRLLDGGDYELDLTYFDFFNFDRSPFFSEKLFELFGPPRKRGEPLEQRHYDIAAAGQRLFSSVMTHLLNALFDMTGCSGVVLSGGVALNCLFNGSIVDKTPFSRCSIPFAPDDSGNAIGAALEISHRQGNSTDGFPATSALGPEYGDEEIIRMLEGFQIPYTSLSDRVGVAASLLAEGKIIGWFQGRGEFGQRALGHRSILASPANKHMKDRINQAVKFRETFRPFAPVVLLEKIGTLFDTTDPDPVPFMEKAFHFKPGMGQRVPAVVHRDGTGRLQSVCREYEPLLYELLSVFEKRTGIPALLNTSFNLNGEPIVQSPQDALRTFVSSGMDALLLGRLLIEKSTLFLSGSALREESSPTR